MAHLGKWTSTILQLLACIALSTSSCSIRPFIDLQAVSPSGLSSQQVENLVAFTRLLGYIQYFHPSDGSRNTDWEVFTLHGVPLVESATNSRDLAIKLNELFLPIAPTIQIISNPESSTASTPFVPLGDVEDLFLLSWTHYGFGRGISQEIYYEELISRAPTEGLLSDEMISSHSLFKADLGGGITATIPLVLVADNQGTLPAGNPFEPQSNPATIGNDRIRRISTVALAWNVFQHFYPYLELTQMDWEGSLKSAFIAADKAQSEEEFLFVLQRMLGRLHDGHARVYSEFPPSGDLYRPPFGWDWVDAQLLITFVDEDLTRQLKPGDRVLAINGQPISEVMETKRESISGATHQWVEFRSIQDLLLGPPNSIITLTVQSSTSVIHTNQYHRTVFVGNNNYLFTETRPPAITEINPNIWYVDLSRITDAQFANSLPDLARASGIVFDLRGYPFMIGPEILGHLIEEEIYWPQLLIPIYRFPDQQLVSYDEIVQTIEPRLPRLTSNTVFIADGRVISYGESLLQIISSNGISKIAGTPTAGTNGNVAVFTLFGKYTFQFTAMKVLNLDGSQHHGVGVQPDFYISRTRAGVLAGRDELLEEAINKLKPTFGMAPPAIQLPRHCLAGYPAVIYNSPDG